MCIYTNVFNAFRQLSRNDLLLRGKISTTKTLNSPSIHNIITGATHKSRQLLRLLITVVEGTCQKRVAACSHYCFKRSHERFVNRNLCMIRINS